MNAIDEATMLEMLMIYRQNQAHVPILKLYVEFEQLGNTHEADESLLSGEDNIDWKENNSDSEEEFLANNDMLGGNDGGNKSHPEREVHGSINTIASRYSFDVPFFMRALDLDAMHAPEFAEFANPSIPFVQDGEFAVGMEFGSREDMVMAIRRYTLSKGVDYRVYESEPLTFYAKYLQYGRGSDWLIQASLIQRKCCWKIRRYNESHMCTMGMISQDHSKLDSDTIADAIRPLVEVDPSLKARLVIADVQSKFNYTISYRKAWLAKQKSIAKMFGSWKVSYESFPAWCMAMCAQNPGSMVQQDTTPAYHGSEVEEGIKIMHRVDGTHLYGKYKGALLVVVSQDGNKNIVPLAFAIVEGKTADVWYFFQNNLRRNVVRRDGVGIISDWHDSISAAMARCNDSWSPPRAFHPFCVRHIASNFLRRFNSPYLQKLIGVRRQNNN
ncbi:uncharacterized protein LOC107615969 [Arachis ipaensis]|uniref:uncharacterized protein LOC107615969 n=1 Tax=Arachis ipaensis TaxID=130454 RepID=UPI0007AEEA0A|nr:uncharacterized protein LOC107615969 [Arachis ipaensis]XP_025678954.1 uncharacterized protein LOC112778896 [Arachis hypogaea]